MDNVDRSHAEPFSVDVSGYTIGDLVRSSDPEIKEALLQLLREAPHRREVLFNWSSSNVLRQPGVDPAGDAHDDDPRAVDA